MHRVDWWLEEAGFHWGFLYTHDIQISKEYHPSYPAQDAEGSWPPWETVYTKEG